MIKNKVLIIGETCDDIFIYGDVERLSPEAPVPVIMPKYTKTNFGMASNVKTNLDALGCDTTLITNSQIIEKKRFVDDSYNYILLRVDSDDRCEPINLLNLPDTKFDVVVISDYDKGFLSIKDIEYIRKKYQQVPIFMDTKKEFGDWISDIDYIKINHKEYKNNETFLQKNKDILNKTIITRGKHGCQYKGKDYPTENVEVKDVIGAGDTFLSGLVFKYIQTNSISDSIEFGNKCSTNVVQKRGVAILDIDEINE